MVYLTTHSRFDQFAFDYLIHCCWIQYKSDWMGFCILVLHVLTLHVVYSQVQIKVPSVCDNAKKRHGVGFNPHPYDCTQFVQCFYYRRGKRIEPVYRNCEYGQFWDQKRLRCLPAHMVDCKHDKCKDIRVQFYKHSDPNQCSAYWRCINRKSYGQCCPDGEGFHPKQGCIPLPDCKDMCPLKDRVPGCSRRPMSGAPTKFEQYTDNGIWRRENCPKGAAYNPADCDCTLKDLIVAGRVCKPDVVINFNNGLIEDVSGNGYTIYEENVYPFRRAGYFRGDSKLAIEPLKPSPYDEGVLIIKLRFREDRRRKVGHGLQALVTNGHCGKEPSVVIAKLDHLVLLGAEANMSRSFPLPIVNKPWKEVIYIKDDHKLEGRVCGATLNDWCLGKVKDTNCGFQIGFANNMAGFVGLIDDISIYRCKPLDAVINLNY